MSQNCFDLSELDSVILRDLTVPTDGFEPSRLKVLRETQLLDTSTSDPIYDRYTSLCRRIFKVVHYLLFYFILTLFFYQGSSCISFSCRRRKTMV